MTHTFTHLISNSIVGPEGDSPLEVEVTYRIADLGVTMKQDEKLWPVITSVMWEEQELEPDIPDDLRAELENKAWSHWQDERDLARWGGEAI